MINEPIQNINPKNYRTCDECQHATHIDQMEKYRCQFCQFHCCNQHPGQQNVQCPKCGEYELCQWCQQMGKCCVKSSELPNDWKLILTKKEIKFLIKKCADYLNHHFSDQDVIVACILKGASYFFVDLTRHLTFPHSAYFIEASSYKNSQTQSEELEILSVIHPEKFQNKKVILLDELFDNGKTLENVKVAIANKANIPLENIFTCTIFRKNKSSPYQPPDLCGMIVPDVWLVGYGLDSQQKLRNLTSLWACPKMEGIPKSQDDELFDDLEMLSKWRGEVKKYLMN